LFRGCRRLCPAWQGDLPFASQKFKQINRVGRIPMKFRPLHDRVVVKRIDAEEKFCGVRERMRRGRFSM
jgi:hypothetical protein